MLTALSTRDRLLTLLRTLSQRYLAEGWGRHLARSAFGTAGLKVAYSALNFITGILLARWLGAAGFGMYAYAFAWVVVLAVPSGLGLDVLLVREVAASRVQSAWERVRVLLRQTSRLTVLASIGLGVLAAAVDHFFPSDPQVRLTLWAALLFLPVLNLQKVIQAGTQGLGHTVSAQLPGLLVSPLLFLILLVASKWIIGSSLSAPFAMGLFVIAALIALIFGRSVLNRFLPTSESVRPVDKVSLWARSVPLLVLLGVIQIAEYRLATLMLGAIRGPESVGIYTVASRGAEYVNFFLGAWIPGLAPTIASLYVSKDIVKLQRVITTSARVTFALAVPVALVFFFFGSWYLALYGQAFTQGVFVLTIFSVGQLVNVASGPTAFLLVMTGQERHAIKCVAAGLAANTLLNIVLIPMYGINGAAIAATASLVIWNLSMVVFVYRKIGIHSTVLGNLKFRRAS